MNNRTKVMIAAAGSAVVVAGGLLAQGAFAASSATQPQSLVQEIAAKFNLKQADVQAVVDTHKQEVETYHEQAFTDQLNQAVTDGKLTTAQKDLIITERATVKAQADKIRDMATATERETALKQLRTDVQDWATKNNIDMKWLRPEGGPRAGHHGGMMGGRMGGDMMQNDAPPAGAPVQ